MLDLFGLDDLLIAAIAFATFGECGEAMLAWGNQSCGRLGLQEKRMEKVGCQIPLVFSKVESLIAKLLMS